MGRRKKFKYRVWDSTMTKIVAEVDSHSEAFRLAWNCDGTFEWVMEK